MPRDSQTDLQKASRATFFRRQKEVRSLQTAARAATASNVADLAGNSMQPGYPFDPADLDDSNVPLGESSSAFQLDNEPSSEQIRPPTSQTSRESPIETICLKVLDFYNKHKLTNTALDDFLEIISFSLKLVKPEVSFPNSIYLFKKFLNLNLHKEFFFKTKCCSFEIENFKQIGEIACGTCNVKISQREIAMQRNYFFRYHLREQLRFLLNLYGLAEPVLSEVNINTPYDGLVYRQFIDENPGKTICFMKFFCDGAELYRLSKTSAWTLFVMIDALRTGQIQNKIFLNSCFVGTTKPDVHFFLRELIAELNDLWANGIYIESVDSYVHPIMIFCFLDAGAR